MKILICGLGGIGSWLIGEITECVKQNQIEVDIQFDIADDDMVECKNVQFQNYTNENIGEMKSVALANRYSDYCWLNPIKKKITKKTELVGYDLIITCADNFKIRKLVFEYAHKNKIDFIDLRSEGRFIMAFPKSEDFTYDLETLNLSDETNGSCQRKIDLEKGWLQKGYKIVAVIGVQMLLNWLRNEKNPKILMRI